MGLPIIFLYNDIYYMELLYFLIIISICDQTDFLSAFHLLSQIFNLLSQFSQKWAYTN